MAVTSTYRGKDPMASLRRNQLKIAGMLRLVDLLLLRTLYGTGSARRKIRKELERQYMKLPLLYGLRRPLAWDEFVEEEAAPIATP